MGNIFEETENPESLKIVCFLFLIYWYFYMQEKIEAFKYLYTEESEKSNANYTK